MTAIPYLITPPEGLPVSLEDMKAHLRVVHDEDDADIEAKQAGVVAMLDAWGGILGRCILPQTWAIDVAGGGPHVFPFPDIDLESIDVGSDGPLFTTKRTGACTVLTFDIDEVQPDEEITIQFSAGMSEERLPAVQSLIKLLVQREFDVMEGQEFNAFTFSIDALIQALRWRRL